MIWLILFLCVVFFYGGYCLCGLLTQYKDDRIRELEGFIIRIAEADAKKREQELKFVQELFEPKETNERIRPENSKPH